MRIASIILLIVGLATKLDAQFSLPEEFWYPYEAIENNIQGKVFVQFTALPTGEIIDSTVQVQKGLGYGLDEIAIQVVKNAPPLNPDKTPYLQEDKPTEYVIRVEFRIHGKHWANYYYERGMKEYDNENYHQALTHLNESVEFADNEAKYYYGLFLSHSKLGNSEEACNNLKTAKRLDRSYKSEWESSCK